MRHKLRGRATAWHRGKQLRSPLRVPEPHARSDRAQATPGEGAAQKAVLAGSPTARSSRASSADIDVNAGRLRAHPPPDGKGGATGTQSPRMANRDQDSGLGSHRPIKVSGSS